MTLEEFFDKLTESITRVSEFEVEKVSETNDARTEEIIDKNWIRMMDSDHGICYCSEACTIRFNMSRTVREGEPFAGLERPLTFISAFLDMGEYDVSVAYWMRQLNIYGYVYSFISIIEYLVHIGQCNELDVILNNTQNISDAVKRYLELCRSYAGNMLILKPFLTSEQTDQIIEGCLTKNNGCVPILLRYKHNNLLDAEGGEIKL